MDLTSILSLFGVDCGHGAISSLCTNKLSSLLRLVVSLVFCLSVKRIMACLSAGPSLAHSHANFRTTSGGFMTTSQAFARFSNIDMTSLDRAVTVENRPPMPVPRPEDSGPCLLDQLVEKVAEQQKVAEEQRERERQVRLGYETTVLLSSESSRGAVPVLQSSMTPPKPKPRKALSRKSSSSVSIVLKVVMFWKEITTSICAKAFCTGGVISVSM